MFNKTNKSYFDFIVVFYWMKEDEVKPWRRKRNITLPPGLEYSTELRYGYIRTQ